MDDLDEARPGLGDRLLHPFTIAVVLAVVAVATCYVPGYLERRRWQAVDLELEPLRQEWAELQARALPRLAAALALIADHGAAADGCAALRGDLPVIARPLLEAFAAGELMPRGSWPSWLSSDAWLYLSAYVTPSHEVAGFRRRNQALREALAAPCLGVLEITDATGTRLVGERRFEGGDVAGLLRIACVDEGRIACELPVVSQPIIAITVKQRNAAAQPDVDRAAVRDAAAMDYWKALESAVRERAPGLVPRREPTPEARRE